MIRWLHHHLFPEQGQELQAGRLALRVRNDRPLLNQVLSQFASYAQAYPDNDELPPCALGLVPGCVIDLRAQQLVPLSEHDWFSSPRKLERGGQRLVSLSRQISGTGGLLGQPMAMGRAHGGALFSAGGWRELADLIASVTDGQLQIGPELLRLDYPVLSTVETLGAYHEDHRRLHLTDPVPADLHVHVWTDAPDTDGFVYEQVLRAVDQGAPPGGGR